ncbi:hypothetical protein AAE478_003531 [Parahypoxylon ruwenzoriense]
MSSMLKKTGGLSFKPKLAGRRAGGAASSSQAPPSSTSNNTTRAPTAESSSQASTPTPSVPVSVPASALTPTPSVEPTSHEAGVPPKEIPKGTPKETPPVETERPLAQAQPASTVRPTPEPTAASIPTPAATHEPPQQGPPSAPIPTSTKSAALPTLTPAAEASPRQSLPVPIAPPAERIARPAPTPEVSTPADTSAAQPDKPRTSSTSATPAVGTTRPTAATNLLTPDPSAPTRDRVAPPTAPPSPAPVSDTIAVVTPANEPPTTAPKKRAPRKRKQATTDGNTDAEGSAPKKRRPRKKATAESGGAEPAEGGDEAPVVKRTYRYRRRSPTPEDAENQTVDHGTTKMGELTKDLGIGKKFKHADAIEERSRQRRAANRQRRLDRQKQASGHLPEGDTASRGSTPVEDPENQGGSTTSRSGRDFGATAASSTQQSVGYEVVDGQIIVNQQSLVVDRHAAHRDMTSLETVEEDEFTHLTTSASWIRPSRRVKANHWSEEDTEKFYRLLKMFGTDFETIAAMFPEKNRRAIKLKFNREELLCPKRIDATVMVRGEKKVVIDIEEYKSHQTHWQDSNMIMAEHAKLVQEHNEDIRRLKAERRAAGLMDDDDEDDEDAAGDGEGGAANGQDGGDAVMDEEVQEDGVEVEDEAIPA